MSNTPETDALYAQMLAENPGNFIHLEEFLELACRLERERNHAESEMRKWMGFAQSAVGQRDEAWNALSKIEEIFVDGCDSCADREKMGLIARTALEESK